MLFSKKNKAPRSVATANHHGLMTVLVARFSALGDVAMTVPVLYSVARCNPDVRFVMVTRPAMTQIFVNPPANLTVVGADLKEDYRGPQGMWRLFRELHGEYRFDAFADLHDVLRTRLLRLICRLHGIPVRHVFKDRTQRRRLTRRVAKSTIPLRSMRSRYREVFNRLGLPVTERFNGLYGARNSAPADLFADVAPEPKHFGEQWIGIAPFAAHAGKIYPPEKMQQVLHLLAADGMRRRIFLFGGGKHEAEILDRWAAQYPNIVSLAGRKLGFKAELALMNHLDLMVCMDSGNMHLAALAGTRVISIWGATHTACGFKPWRQSGADQIQLPLACRPCSVFGQTPCYRGDYHCLTGIRPEAIYQHIISPAQ